jgi:uncharacterized protein (DUF433 family)
VTPSDLSHISFDDRGRPWVEGTNTKVVEIVFDVLAYGWSAEEIHQHHPHLSQVKIQAALSYYSDHQGEIDAEVERQGREFDQLRMAQADSPLRRRLRASGKLLQR